MAIFNKNSNGVITSITVKENDNLWNIAKETLIRQGKGASNQQIAKEVDKLAALNKLPNEDFLVINQELKLTPSEVRATISPNVTFGRLTTDENKLYVFWTHLDDISDAEKYKLVWTYTDVGGLTFTKTEEKTIDKDAPEASRWSLFNVESGMTKVTVKVKIVLKEGSKATAPWSDVKTYNVSTPLEAPPTPSIKLEGQRLTAELKNLDIVADSIEFRLDKFKNDKWTIGTPTKAHAIDKTTKSVACVWSSVETGCTYRVCARAVKGNLRSEWSGISGDTLAAPLPPGPITTCKAESATEVYLSWGESKTATSYVVEYTTDRKYFDAAGDVTTKPVEEGTAAYISNLTSGQEYFFRVKAKNDGGESKPTAIVSVIIGKEPAPPTTWSSTTTAIVGEKVLLYWVHNSEDGSSETFAQLKLTVREGDKVVYSETLDIKNENIEEDKDKTKFYEFDTSAYSEGAKLIWQVKTAGVLKDSTNAPKYSAPSIERTVDIYAQPTLRLSVTNGVDDITEISAFPFYISAVPGPDTQAPIGYHVSITSDETYETVDAIGNPIWVKAGEEVYSKFFDTNIDLQVMLSAGDVDLEKNYSYTITCVVTMDSGLTAEASIVSLPVTWSENIYTPNARISVDEETYTAYITPYCADQSLVYQKVILENGKYILTNEELEFACPYTDTKLQLRGVYTTTGERVQAGFDGNTEVPESGDVETIYFAEVLKSIPVPNVTLAVYRREFDGKFTEIASGMAANTTATDPHPALDYARYRIVATSTETGAVGYYDLPSRPVGGKSVIIQWDEIWTTFDAVEDGDLAQPPWSGSLLKLPYNIDVSDKHNADVSLIEYIGRARPVSYYGTHLGETSTWNMTIDKNDKETLYALRRLAIWMGDVYVREPSGSGYWANISVSFSQKHKEVTIPVTLDITRVEGGA